MDEAEAEQTVCEGPLYRQEHLLTPLGKPACIPCFNKTLDNPPTQLPIPLETPSQRRSYARPRSLLSVEPVHPDSISPRSRPHFPSGPLRPTLQTEKNDVGGIGAVRLLAARFNTNVPPAEGHVRDMKQSIAELYQYLGNTGS